MNDPVSSHKKTGTGMRCQESGMGGPSCEEGNLDAEHCGRSPPEGRRCMLLDRPWLWQDSLQCLRTCSCLLPDCNVRTLTMRPYMLPGLLRAVFSGTPEGGPAGGLLKAEALSFGGVLSDAVACAGACTQLSGNTKPVKSSVQNAAWHLPCFIPSRPSVNVPRWCCCKDA